MSVPQIGTGVSTRTPAVFPEGEPARWAHPDVSGDEEATMAKGQKRGNREIRKPKAEKPKTLLAAPAGTSVALAFATEDRKKKR